MTDLLADIFWMTICVLIVFYFFVRPFYFITRESLKRRKRERWVKQGQKKYQIADEIWGDRLRSQHQTIKKQGEIITAQQNTINFLQFTSPEPHDGFTNFDMGWAELQRIPKPTRKGCNHQISCHIQLMDESKDFSLQSWNMPRVVTPFELGRLYVALFNGCTGSGQGPGFNMHLSVRCTNGVCEVSDKYDLRITAYTPDGYEASPDGEFRIQRCYLGVRGHVPGGKFNAAYTIDESLRIQEHFAELKKRHLRSVA